MSRLGKVKVKKGPLGGAGSGMLTRLLGKWHEEDEDADSNDYDGWRDDDGEYLAADREVFLKAADDDDGHAENHPDRSHRAPEV